MAFSANRKTYFPCQREKIRSIRDHVLQRSPFSLSILSLSLIKLRSRNRKLVEGECDVQSRRRLSSLKLSSRSPQGFSKRIPSHVKYTAPRILLSIVCLLRTIHTYKFTSLLSTCAHSSLDFSMFNVTVIVIGLPKSYSNSFFRGFVRVLVVPWFRNRISAGKKN